MSYFNASGRKLYRASLAGTTALTLLAGPNFGAPPAGGGGGGGGPLAVQDFTRDKVVYDDGSAVGLASAAVPVFGTGPIGATIEARAVSQDDNGATTTLWVSIGTVSGAGTYAGALTVPYSDSWYKVETRLQTAPTTTAMTPSVFAVGSVVAIWGQSEVARGWNTTYNNTAIPALVTLKQQIANLKQPGMSGRTSRNTLKVAGVDTLPAGASLSGNTITLSGTGTLEDWYIADARVDVVANANWTIRQNIFEEVSENVTPNYQLYVRLNGRATIHDNTFKGMEHATGLSCAIKTEENGSTYGVAHIRRNRFEGLPADAVKIVAGSIRWNYMYWRKNLDVIPTVWSAAVTYNTGDHVWNSTGNAYASKIDNNLNNQPPAGKVPGDPIWNLIDPHVDCITVEKAFERVDIEYNYLDMVDGIAANGGVGMNNFIRYQPNNANPGFLAKVYTRFNLCDKDASAGSAPLQVTTNFLSDIEFYGNWFYPTGGGAPNYPFTAGQTTQITWAGNRHTGTDATFATPANSTAIGFTDKTTDNEIQHIFNDRSPIGSGTTQHKFMTAANRYTVAFAAMANVALMEQPGRKAVFLHHTVSGTGFDALFNDNVSSRMWSDEAAIHNYATVDGASVGIACSSWYASPAALALDYGVAVYELFSKKNWTTGAALTAPFSYPSINPRWSPADHFWGDFYDAARTRWCLMGPHLTFPAEDMINSIRNTAVPPNNINFAVKNRVRCRQGIRNAIADARTAGYFTQQGVEPMNFEMGSISLGFGDWSHPSSDTIDGLGQFLSMHVHGAYQAMGLSKWAVPEFDQVFWPADGSYVEVWSNAGDVTTTRKQRGMVDIGTTHTHWTDCFGWEWCTGVPDFQDGNGLTPIQNATIVAADGSGTPATAGRVRITKPGGGTWASGDTVAFGGGGGAGIIQHPDDGNARSWLNTPVVMVGAYGADGNQVGMSLRPLAYFTRP